MAVLQPDVGKNGRLKHLWCFIAKQGKIPTQPLSIDRTHKGPQSKRGWMKVSKGQPKGQSQP